MLLPSSLSRNAALRTLRALSSSPRASPTPISIKVAPALQSFIDTKVLPGTGCTPDQFWTGLDGIVQDLLPRNQQLLEQRDAIQSQIDSWHKSKTGETQLDFLRRIGYLQPSPGAFEIETARVGDEIARVAGPQLVCPVDKSRFLLNAANARWGSLLDAFYGTNAVLPAPQPGPYDPARGVQVFEMAHKFLDETFPFAAGRWSEVTNLSIADGALVAKVAGAEKSAPLRLAAPDQLVGYGTRAGEKWSILLRKNGLHCEIVIDGKEKGVGRATLAGIVDVRLESALTTICDFEDSACTVDVDDKVAAYSNWLGLMNRTLSCEFPGKNGTTVNRTLNPRLAFHQPKHWPSKDASSDDFSMSAQVLLLARNVGMHKYTDMVTTEAGAPVPEHFVDAMVTAACALHDVRVRREAGDVRNSVEGSVYIVKPKMHGPEEVGLAVDLFAAVEKALGMPPLTMKMGIMDEERRTSVNLASAMQAARQRLVFINTGFLDRLLRTKGAQIAAGASTAWVPSPTAATLHALHYLQTSVASVQGTMATAHKSEGVTPALFLADLITPPLMTSSEREALTPVIIQKELDNNVQSLLGYVVRWVGQGVGCSKVPDLEGVQLMEDRATLRISSQHIANWRHHGVVSDEQVLEAFHRIAHLVDEQNASDPTYKAFAPRFDGPEWHAALELVFSGTTAPNGYTEPTLTKFRQQRKALDASSEGSRPNLVNSKILKRGGSSIEIAPVPSGALPQSTRS
ncbi:malate synthase g [Chrysochromulina tobinii]|uniref:Malate synthase g n=1 Tax=Chrysochromulina tobinii TaxID=1460289 RepID=A0A0M0JR25_9EUKA|nr:malate synthase g [Chrysochromulina tobinii]|eukprot:KOO29044.1 malate synthase g [Chrysochromulina sp. CCMP291]